MLEISAQGDEISIMVNVQILNDCLPKITFKHRRQSRVEWAETMVAMSQGETHFQYTLL